jgi:hypothetical protein
LGSVTAHMRSMARAAPGRGGTGMRLKLIMGTSSRSHK